MKKRIAVLVDDLFHILETWVPYYRLKEEGFEVLLIGGTKGPFLCKEGKYSITPDFSIKEVKAEEFDGVVVPGGFAPDKLRRYDEVKKFVKTLFEQNKLVAAICHGPWVLVSAKILNGKKVTGTVAIKDDVENAGATFVDKEVVIDGNIITSRVPADLPAFCREIVNFLKRK